jgi:hypothetical protein
LLVTIAIAFLILHILAGVILLRPSSEPPPEPASSSAYD